MQILSFIKSKSFLKQIIIAIIGVSVFLFILSWWLGFTTNHDQKIQVPDLNKMSLTEVRKTLKTLDLDFKVIDSANYNSKYPKKSVIEQDPEAGDFVKEKRKIYVTINRSKYKDITIPKVLGRTKRLAISTLKAKGFTIGKLTYIPDLGKDVVRGIRYKGKEVKEGDKLPKTTSIDLVLGNGNGA